MGGGAREGGAIGFVGAAFRAGDEGGAELRCDRAERKSGANALPIHDAARRDHRQSALGDEQAGEGEGAELVVRSEEHTSELQSLMRISYAVFCLKKKNKT